MNNPLLTAAQAAERLGVTRATVNKWAATGTLPTADKFPGRTGPRLFDPEVVNGLKAAGTLGRARHPYNCSTCGRACTSTAKWYLRHAPRCRPCIRIANGWQCQQCGSTDPEHPSPCPDARKADQ
ncbi:helix-turn-helix transcriptional regulator [Propionibacteriaceae bacterium G57]|uniref:helix-turn-helix transcriptional regulator n=1 Tax=Aestuariimicrobium sp. G57 TaxID=3418485 RepID=UPI003DA727C8